MLSKFKPFVTLLVLVLFVSGHPELRPAHLLTWQEKVDPSVLAAATGGETEFLLYLQSQADLSQAAGIRSRVEKGAYVYRTLVEIARDSQKPLLDMLEGLGVAYQPYWVVNMIWVRGNATIVEAMARRQEVAHIYANPHTQFDEPISQHADNNPYALIEIEGEGDKIPAGVEWNINLVGAPQVWVEGYTGQAVTIGGADTGYDWDHPALINQYRGWDGNNADHNYNWHDAIHDSDGNECGNDAPAPCDDYGHGTHTMGIMVGDDGGSNQIGMAPGARWIGCRNMDDGFGTPARYSECYQWFIAPWPYGGDPFQDGDPSKAPDVINNSWSCTPGEGCGVDDPDILRLVVENVRTAGILTAHSAGNGGNGCESVDQPAAIYAASFAVGATDSSDGIAGFSSRGPVTVDGSNRRKPDISAPGVGVRSCTRGTGYGSMSGTSMAAPHVAGLVALLISANPEMRGQVDVLEDLIESSALPIVDESCGGEPGGIPNNVYGWGRIDAWNAYACMNLPVTLALQKDAIAIVEPGGIITYTLGITNPHPCLPVSGLLLTDTIPANTDFISATEPYILENELLTWQLPGLSPGQAWWIELIVQAHQDYSGTITNAAYGAYSTETGAIAGEPVQTQVLDYSLQVEKSAPAHALPGELLTYTLAITNPHPSADLYQIVLTDTLPAGTAFISASGSYSLAGEMVEWVINNLPAGTSQVVHLTVRIPGAPGVGIVNEAYAVRCNEVPEGVRGTPVSTRTSYATYLPGVVRTHSP